MDDVVADRSTGRRGRLVLAAVVGLGVLLVVALVVVLARSSDDNAAAPADTPHQTEPAEASVPAFRWDEVAGVRVPWSATHGPRIVEGGEASRYSRSEQGAALAAAQVLMRTSASAGSDVFLPAIATQVTGPNTAAMKATLLQQYERLRVQAAVADGAPIPGADGLITGYRVAAYDADAGTATVDVVVDSAVLRTRGQLLSFAVSLLWAYDDWRVLAPPRGDWGAVATQLGTPPAGLQLYEQIG
jgi:hypothetical protein